MTFNIIGFMERDNSFVFNGQTYYVPRQNEELEINGAIFVVKNVRYKLVNGSNSMQNVELKLIRIK